MSTVADARRVFAPFVVADKRSAFAQAVGEMRNIHESEAVDDLWRAAQASIVPSNGRGSKPRGQGRRRSQPKRGNGSTS